MCEAALNNEAGINQTTHNGSTPLYMASKNGHKEVCALLLDRGADVNQAKQNGCTPLYMASKNGHKEVCALLLDRGANVDQAKQNGWTPLLIASHKGHTDVCALLIDRGANVNQNTREGSTPLYIASQEGHTDVCALLLDRGVNVNQARPDGLAPLFIASQKGHEDVCALLLDRGADVAHAVNNNRTALCAASRNGHKEVCRLLRDWGAQVVQSSSGVKEDIRTFLEIKPWACWEKTEILEASTDDIENSIREYGVGLGRYGNKKFLTCAVWLIDYESSHRTQLAKLNIMINAIEDFRREDLLIQNVTFPRRWNLLLFRDTGELSLNTTGNIFLLGMIRVCEMVESGTEELEKIVKRMYALNKAVILPCMPTEPYWGLYVWHDGMHEWLAGISEEYQNAWENHLNSIESTNSIEENIKAEAYSEGRDYTTQLWYNVLEKFLERFQHQRTHGEEKKGV